MYECESGRKMSTWEIVLIALGSPLWVPLLIAALAVVFSLYVSLWSVIISFFAVQASLLAVAFGTILPGIVFLFSENAVSVLL